MKGAKFSDIPPRILGRMIREVGITICLMLIIFPALAIEKKTTSQENIALSLVLKHKRPKDGYNLVEPITSIRNLQGNLDDINFDIAKNNLKKRFLSQGLNIGHLVDQLFERNRQATHLTLKSSSKDGYIIDYGHKSKNRVKGKTADSNYWEQWSAANPLARSITTVSVPIYDVKSNLILIYVEHLNPPPWGGGTIFFFGYNNGVLRELNSLTVWIS